MTFLPIYFYFIVISFLTSLSVYFHAGNQYKYLRIFPPFLLATIIIEVVGTYLASVHKANIWLYNFFTVIEFDVYLWLIRVFIDRAVGKRVLALSIAAYTLIALFNIVFVQGVFIFHTVTYALGCLLIVGACVYYFLELFRRPTSVNLTGNPSFWICSGLLFFYCCGFPLYGLSNLIAGISRLIIMNFYSIINILNIFLYTLFTIAFLCRLKARKYTLSPS